jgi:pseudouridine synthase
MKERLQKLMAMAGYGSRRDNEDLIRAGRVRVNGKVAKLGDQADPGNDVIEVDGTRLSTRSLQARVYYAIFKPRNVLAAPTERADDERRTVYQFVPYKGHLFSIGRLDADSEGLVVLTNDGEMAQKISHPRYRHTKTYRVVVEGLPTAETILRWEGGVFLEEGKTAPCYVKIARGGVSESVLHIVMTEGKKRQIRRVASILGHPVIRLTRVAIGRLELGEMKPGEFRELDEDDIERLSTPASELRIIRGRKGGSARPPRPAPTDDGEEKTAPRGTGKHDDVRSDRQRRLARGENPPPERSSSERSSGGPRGRFSGLEHPRRPQAAPPREEGERPRRRPQVDRPQDQEGERPRRPAAPRPRRDSDDAPPARPASGRPPQRGDDSTPRKRRPSSRPANDGGKGRNSSRPTGTGGARRTPRRHSGTGGRGN